jgi:hypothetical protein
MPIILFTLLFITQVAFSQASSTIEYKSNSTKFLISKSLTTFKFGDGLGDRDFAIKDCNKALVQDFWKSTTDKIAGLQSSADSPPVAAAWVKVDGIQFPVLKNEKAHAFFNSIPSKSHVLFSESQRLCKGK